MLLTLNPTKRSLEEPVTNFTTIGWLALFVSYSAAPIRRPNQLVPPSLPESNVATCFLLNQAPACAS